MICRWCEIEIEQSAVPGLPLCEQCTAAILAPRYDPIDDVLTEADIFSENQS